MKLISFSPWKLFVKSKRFIGSEEKPESSVQMNLQRSYDMMNIACKSSPEVHKSEKIPVGYTSVSQHLLLCTWTFITPRINYTFQPRVALHHSLAGELIKRNRAHSWWGSTLLEQ